MQTPQTKFLRTKQIIPAILPISRSAWFLGIREGRYPQGIKLSPRTTVWDAEVIQALCDEVKRRAADSLPKKAV